MDTLKYFFKPTNTELNVPVTKTFPKGKQVWNIGEYNPYINDGYVILCDVDAYCNVNPDSLEFLYVGNSDNAKILHKVADYLSVSIDNLNRLKNYEDKRHKDIMVKAFDIIETYRAKEVENEK